MNSTAAHSDERLRSFSLRQLKAVLRVSELQNITQAAHTLSRSQTAVTKSVSEVESDLGIRLFNRSTSGLTPTVYGTAFAKRLAAIQRILESANRRYQSAHRRPKPIHQIPLFTMDLSARRLATLVALGSAGDVKVAAREMDLTPSAIYKFVRELEAQLDLDVFERRPSGAIRPTDFGEILLRDIRLIFAELRHSLEDLANIDGQVIGRVTVGTMPSTRPIIVPAALDRLLREHPKTKAATREGTFQRLLYALGSGDIDMVISGTRPIELDDGLKVVHLFDDRLSLVAGASHPLAKKKEISVDDLRAAHWVLPPANTPARTLYNEILRDLHIDSNIESVETNSVIVMRSLLVHSNYISLTSLQQTELERKSGQIKTLPFTIPDDSWPVGVLLREETEPSPLANALLNELKEISKSI